MAQLSTIDFVYLIVQRLALVVMWLTFAVFHLALFVIVLIVLWSLQIPPQTLVEQFVSFAQSRHAAVVGLLGISAATILVLWVKLWRIVYGKLITPYLFRDVNEVMRS